MSKTFHLEQEETLRQLFRQFDDPAGKWQNKHFYLFLFPLRDFHQVN
jgi:hypothetical protein